MKRKLLTMLVALVGLTAWGQSLLVGDANQDGELTIADVTKSVNLVLHPETQSAIDMGALAYKVDNSMLVGTWQLGTERATFRADGTTTYPEAATYKFRPWKGTLILNDADGAVVKIFEVLDIADDALVLREEGGTLLTGGPVTSSSDYSQAALGDIFYSDGTFCPSLVPGKTPIGVVAYVGSDAFSENGATLRDGSTTLQSHGLVLSLRDAGNMWWNPSDNSYKKLQFASDAKVNSTASLKRSTYVSGYANSRQLGSNSDFYACYAAWNYTDLAAPLTTTGWFLPTAQQWVKMLGGLGAVDESAIEWEATFDSGLSSVARWEAAMSVVGDKGTAFDGLTDKTFWSSSEATGTTAVRLVFSSGAAFSYDLKYNYSYYVRPVLAF